ncbi:MAG: hypothetical protein PHT49_01060 [Desulfovibrionales bacterium]|nr:hypothetical protein [Desulfovibrionales bacterium]
MTKTRKSIMYGEFAAIKSFNPREFEGFKTNTGLNSIWEQLNNPDFNPVEFDGIKMLAGLNSFALTPKLTTAPALKQIKG